MKTHDKLGRLLGYGPHPYRVTFGDGPGAEQRTGTLAGCWRYWRLWPSGPAVIRRESDGAVVHRR
jgi:hypothetical protein